MRENGADRAPRQAVIRAWIDAGCRRRKRAAAHLCARVAEAAEPAFERRPRAGSALVARLAFLEECGNAFERVRVMQRCDEVIALGAEVCIERLRGRIVEQ